jgi:hypothetical protein
MMSLEIVQSADHRDILSGSERGVYYVHKRNCLAAFPFGEAGHYDTAKEAFDAMQKFLQSRKDSAKLRVTLID